MNTAYANLIRRIEESGFHNHRQGPFGHQQGICTTYARRVRPSPMTSLKGASSWTFHRPRGARASSTWWSPSPTATTAGRT